MITLHHTQMMQQSPHPSDNLPSATNASSSFAVHGITATPPRGRPVTIAKGHSWPFIHMEPPNLI
jgi:hypothetical protein